MASQAVYGLCTDKEESYDSTGAYQGKQEQKGRGTERKRTGRRHMTCPTNQQRYPIPRRLNDLLILLGFCRTTL